MFWPTKLYLCAWQLYLLLLIWNLRPNTNVFSIIDQKEITIDETYCWSTDHLGRPIDIYSDPDYRMQCIGYWKENLKSYLITYDQLDAFTKYRCWVNIK